MLLLCPKRELLLSDCVDERFALLADTFDPKVFLTVLVFGNTDRRNCRTSEIVTPLPPNDDLFAGLEINTLKPSCR